ncbi:MAG: anaerobic glycerol-3-phosphate dehydrogenase subunit [Symbiobacteriaceae bacterium]|jgi:glycerol-3-phosphate dehydrogenase subunit B|nr:anaerobic glycerol-3-phosphate dehydrogenase subunit [Symbiobacteriaceae bacterium]
MMKRSRTYDVVVIGAGLAGLMAALGARRAGAEVAVVAEGGGALELSSGSVDLLAGPWDALAEGHPYRLVGSDGIRDGLDAFLAAASAAGLPYMEDAEHRNQAAVTAVGSLRPTYLPAPGAAVVQPGCSVHVVGFQGLREFHPQVVAEGLRRAMPGLPVTWGWSDLPDGVTSLHPLQIARQLEEPACRRQLAARLAGQGVGAALFLPAVLGLDQAPAVRAELSAAHGGTVAEVPLLSPSLPGLRLGSALTRHVQRAGADLHLGARAVGAACGQGRIDSITCQTVAGAVAYRAGAFVLATGGLLGRGLDVGARVPGLPDAPIYETIFGLPVEVPAGPLAATELLAPGGHGFVRAGIRTDEHLRPPGWSNLHICGKMLAGYDPYAEGSGGGVAIATGWRAGLLAGGVAK